MFLLEIRGKSTVFCLFHQTNWLFSSLRETKCSRPCSTIRFASAAEMSYLCNVKEEEMKSMLLSAQEHGLKCTRPQSYRPKTVRFILEDHGPLRPPQPIYSPIYEPCPLYFSLIMVWARSGPTERMVMGVWSSVSRKAADLVLRKVASWGSTRDESSAWTRGTSSG